jgi:[acyl-carrier-protein] S-malonyltransferase
MARTALLFPGQGAQFVGMGAQLAAGLPQARALFDEAAEVLGYDLHGLCVNGPSERLNATDVSQPAIYVASLAALEQLKATDPAVLDSVVGTAGLSLGEYTALTFASSLSFRDGLTIVQARGRAMQAAAEAIPSGMISVIGMNADEVEALVAEARTVDVLEVANLLCPGNVVVSGTTAALDRLEQLCQTRGGIRTVRLSVAGAFHTRLMKPADERLAEALDQIEVRAPRVPVWSNVDARPHSDAAEIRALLVRQVITPVLWEKTMRGLIEEAAVETFYEVGPQRVLAGLLKRINRKTDVRNVSA